MKSGSEKTDGIIRGFGSLLSIGIRRHVHFERRPIREVSVSRAWQNVGDSLREAMGDADKRYLKP